MYSKNSFFFQKRLNNLLHKISDKINNDNNNDFFRNGEDYLLWRLSSHFSSSEKSVVFDVGANKGDWSKLWLSRNKNAEMHLFEPSQLLFKSLKEQFKEQNLFISNTALGDKSGKFNLFYDYSGSGLASLTKRDLGLYGIEMNKSEEVDCKRLDSYILENKIKKINLLKIDVEGNELKVMEGLGDYLHPDFIDVIQFEYGGTFIDSNTYLKNIFDLLKKSGFLVGKLYPKSICITDYSFQLENFKYSNWVAINKNISIF